MAATVANPSDRKAIVQEYERIRRTYFPRLRGWRLRVQYLDHAGGKADQVHRRIIINPSFYPHPQGRLVLLVHELCHAAASSGHGVKWMRRLLKTAGRARALGEIALAEGIEKEVKAYDSAPKVTPQSVYQSIKDAVMDCPTASFKAVLDFVRRDNGCSRKGFMKLFRRARAVFEEAKKWMKEEEEGRKRFFEETD